MTTAEATPRGPGRPRIDPKDQTVLVGFRVTQGDRDWFVEQAQLRGISKSQLLRRMLRVWRTGDGSVDE